MNVLTENERWVLSYYRASELAGSLFFGRLSRVTEDDDLRILLTEQFSEEAHHAWLWTKTLRDLGSTPLKITETYQSKYALEIGIPTTMSEILTITKVFEERIFDHFTKHLKSPKAHPEIKKALESMLEEEAGHIGWIDKKLNSIAHTDSIDIDSLYKEYLTVDQRVYDQIRILEAPLFNFFEI